MPGTDADQQLKDPSEYEPDSKQFESSGLFERLEVSSLIDTSFGGAVKKRYLNELIVSRKIAAVG